MACLAAVDHAQQDFDTSAICKSPANSPRSRSLLVGRLFHDPNTTCSAVLGRNVGGILGITVALAVYQNTLKQRLWDPFDQVAEGPEIIRRVLDGLEELKRLPKGWREGVIAPFMETFQLVWAMMVLWTLMALVCVALLKKPYAATEDR